MIKIHCLREAITGVGYHRLELPFANLNGNYPDLKITIGNGYTFHYPPEQFDIIVLNRVSRCDVNYIQRAKDNGVKIILDLDDWIEMPEWHTAHHGIETPIIEQRVVETIGLADVIWCASDYLKQCIGFPARTITIPNAIDFTQTQFIPVPQKRELYTIGYIAGSAHHLDMEVLAKPFQKLMKRNDYKMLVGGHAPADDLNSKPYWEYVYAVFSSGGALMFDKRFIKVPAVDCYNYAQMYNLIDCALAPLNNDTWSKCKSNIKVLEAGAFSLPIICSNVEPYKEFISQGLVYELTGKVDNRLNELISDPKKGIMMGRQLHSYVREFYDINIINKIRYDSITSLMD